MNFPVTHLPERKLASMSRRSDRPHRHSRSSRSQQYDIPIDPSLTEATYPENSETQSYGSYTQAGPTVTSESEAQDTGQMEYCMMQQPATVNPNEVLLDRGSVYAAQSYPSSAYQIAGYTEPVASSSTAQAASDYYCPKCRHSYDSARDFNKHMKTHNKPVKCEASPNCNVTKAEQRDMDRHYQTSHKAYAASKNILTEEVVCGFEGCPSTFTRRDNLRKHWKKFHGYEPTK
ncbi:hypothetical protein KAF25_006153 [Fusarium avenaceum]|uniref:C2H2-type domain-containing protein n=1 Tax=Fusarium avenaceum TaxID=40199 RepID=A0A9P7GWS9_9HYPO|nr:hypothetical protein KAF25_006153 [Fusarium avenaceum]